MLLPGRIKQERFCMKKTKEAEKMIEMAARDLRAASAMENINDFPDEIFGFHAQQAVEKALKGWLSYKLVIYPKTHDIEMLFLLLKEHNENIPKKFDTLIDLVDFAVEFRYNFFNDDEPIDRKTTCTS